MVKKLNNLKIKRRFIKCSKFLLDLFFPSFCVGCGSEGSLLCRKCKKGIIRVQLQTCPDCGRINSTGVYCALCRFETIMVKKKNKKKSKKVKRRKALQGIIVATYYEEGPIKEMIHNFKYNHALELKKVLSNLLAQAVNQKTFDLITFAPLHRRRLAERGFNQAEILAEETAKKLKLTCETTLVKVKSTKRQVGLTGQKRRKNLTGVFKVTKSLRATIVAKQSKVHGVQSIRRKKILIVDDITTTGTTLNECAKVLKMAGAKEVWGLVVARG